MRTDHLGLQQQGGDSGDDSGLLSPILAMAKLALYVQTAADAATADAKLRGVKRLDNLDEVSERFSELIPRAILESQELREAERVAKEATSKLYDVIQGIGVRIGRQVMPLHKNGGADNASTD